MNEAAFNASAFNAPAPSVFQSSVVNGIGYAVGTAISGLVLRRAPLDGVGQAAAAGVFGRPGRRNPGPFFASAEASPAGRAVVRSAIAGSAAAVLADTSQVLTRFVCRADAAIRARALRFSAITGAARADASPATRPMRRSPVQVAAKAVGGVDGLVLERHEFSDVIAGAGTAFAVLDDRTIRRAPGLYVAAASAVALPQTLRRSPVAGQAAANATVDGSSFYRGPYDEPAPRDRTFVVPARQSLFIVTGGTMTFKIKQQPREVLDYDYSFDQFFPADDQVTEVQIVRNTPAGLVLSTAIDADKRVVKLWVSGGADGGVYSLSLLGKTNDGRAKEVDISVRIKDEA